MIWCQLLEACKLHRVCTGVCQSHESMPPAVACVPGQPPSDWTGNAHRLVAEVFGNERDRDDHSALTTRNRDKRVTSSVCA
jgi:hypothetical protein